MPLLLSLRFFYAPSLFGLTKMAFGPTLCCIANPLDIALSTSSNFSYKSLCSSLDHVAPCLLIRYPQLPRHNLRGDAEVHPNNLRHQILNVDLVRRCFRRFPVSLEVVLKEIGHALRGDRIALPGGLCLSGFFRNLRIFQKFSGFSSGFSGFRIFLKNVLKFRNFWVSFRRFRSLRIFFKISPDFSPDFLDYRFFNIYSLKINIFFLTLYKENTDIIILKLKSQIHHYIFYNMSCKRCLPRSRR